MERWSHTLSRSRLCSTRGAWGWSPLTFLGTSTVSCCVPWPGCLWDPPKVLQSLGWGASAGTRGQHHPSPLRRSVWREHHKEAVCLLFKSPDCLSLLLLALTSWAALGCFLHVQARGGWKGGRQGQTRWPPFSTCLMPQCWDAEQWDHWVKLGPQADALRF